MTIKLFDRNVVRNSITTFAAVPQVFAWGKAPVYETSEIDVLFETVWFVAASLRKEGYDISREAEQAAYDHAREVIGNGPFVIALVQSAVRRFLLS